MASQPIGGGEPLSEINVTPLVDVMLVLLVIFMVTAPLTQQGVEVDLPETRSTSTVTVKDSDVILTLDQKQRIFIAKTEIKPRALTAKLKEIYRQKTKKEIYLKADKTIPYGFVVKVMALVKNAGIAQMGMITDPDMEPL